jgi:hypothetical protein
MATTTPNYGWAVPTSTDLVKDGATAIETLGDAIDASMNTALGTKKAGMVLLNTTSFSAVASQSINDVFSATYKNYKIVLNFATAAAIDKVISMRLRKAGVDFSGASQYENISLGITSAGTASNATNSATSFTLLNNAHYTSQRSVILDILNARGGTTISGQAVGGTSAVTNALNINGICLSNDTYDGFTIITSASNFTTASTVSVYGYNV